MLFDITELNTYTKIKYLTVVEVKYMYYVNKLSFLYNILNLCVSFNKNMWLEYFFINYLKVHKFLDAFRKKKKQDPKVNLKVKLCSYKCKYYIVIIPLAHFDFRNCFERWTVWKVCKKLCGIFWVLCIIVQVWSNFAVSSTMSEALLYIKTV